MYSKTFNLLKRLFHVLPKKRRLTVLKIIPFALLTGIADLLVIGLVSRLFIAFTQKENNLSIPFANLITTDPLTKLIILVFYIKLLQLPFFLFDLHLI